MTTTTGPIRTPFSATSTAVEVCQGIDLTGRAAVVTGGASGIGIETARALAGTGAAVTLAVRDLAAGGQVAADITASTGNPLVHVELLDLADPASVGDFAKRWRGPLHLLVNNAGIYDARGLHGAGLGAAVRHQPPRGTSHWRSGCTMRSRPTGRPASWQ